MHELLLTPPYPSVTLCNDFFFVFTTTGLPRQWSIEWNRGKKREQIWGQIWGLPSKGKYDNATPPYYCGLTRFRLLFKTGGYCEDPPIGGPGVPPPREPIGV